METFFDALNVIENKSWTLRELNEMTLLNKVSRI